MEINKNIVSVIQGEGIEFRKSGKVYKGHCPFHEDRTPSFAVYEDTNRFICFGCGEKGDAIDFIRKLKGFTFKEALSYLKFDKPQLSSTEVKKRNVRLRLIKAFRHWMNDYHDELCTEYRAIHGVIAGIKTIEDAEEIALLYHRLPIIEHHLEVLQEGNDEDHLALYKETELWQRLNLI